MNWKYTNIQHKARIELGLSLIQYCVFDAIYQYQTFPKTSQNGWASISYREISNFFGISIGSVSNIIAAGIDMDLIEMNDANNKLKRTTSKWYESVYTNLDANERSKNEHLRSNIEQGCSKNERKCSNIEQKRSKNEQYIIGSNNSNKSKEEVIIEKPQPQPETYTDIIRNIFEGLREDEMLRGQFTDTRLTYKLNDKEVLEVMRDLVKNLKRDKRDEYLDLKKNGHKLCGMFDSYAKNYYRKNKINKNTGYKSIPSI